MNFDVNEILTLEDNREFRVVNTVFIDDIEYLYLKSEQDNRYTIVKVFNDIIYNLNKEETKLIIENLYRSRWV